MKLLNPTFFKTTLSETVSTILFPFDYLRHRIFFKKKLSYVVAASCFVAILSSFISFNYWQKLQNAEEQLLMAKGKTQMMAGNINTLNNRMYILTSIAINNSSIEKEISVNNVAVNIITETNNIDQLN